MRRVLNWPVRLVVAAISLMVVGLLGLALWPVEKYEPVPRRTSLQSPADVDQKVGWYTFSDGAQRLISFGETAGITVNRFHLQRELLEQEYFERSTDLVFVGGADASSTKRLEFDVDAEGKVVQLRWSADGEERQAAPSDDAPYAVVDIRFESGQLSLGGLLLQPAATLLGPAVADVRADYAPHVLDAQHATEDVKLLRRALQELHPGYGRYTSREALGQLLDALERRAAGGMTDVELYREVSYVLAKIRCSHTKAELPPAMKEYRESTPTYLPFTFRLFAGRMFVDQVDTTQQNLERGDEVLSINGHAISEIVPQVEQYLSVDGWTDHTKRVELESSSELLGDAIDHFWPMLYGWPGEWTIESRGDSGKPVTSVLTPITYPRWLKLITGGQERYQGFGTDTVEFRVLENGAAYLAIDTFVNYRDPIDPVELLKPHFAEMRKQGIEHLVLDLRQCGGGSDDVPQVLTTFLAARPIRIARRPSWVRTYRVGDLRQHLHTWDDSVWNLPAELFNEVGDGFFEFRPPDFRESVTITPREDNFAGRLTILSSARNSSGATNVIALLRGKRDKVSVVGEPTGGSVEGTTAGLIFFLKLPNSGITVRIPALRNFNGIDEFQPGRGVTPDVYVMPGVGDFLEGRDPALEVALRQ